jgi:hypothetical protein
MYNIGQIIMVVILYTLFLEKLAVAKKYIKEDQKYTYKTKDDIVFVFFMFFLFTYSACLFFILKID